MIGRPKHQRLVLALLAIAALAGAALLAMWGLQERAAYFYTPAEIADGKAPVEAAIRLGGMVERGSLARDPDGVTTRFVVEDGQAQVPVSFTGILPDLFRERSGVVAEGRIGADGRFIADNILAKHDERYMPPQLGNQAAEHQAAETVKR